MLEGDAGHREWGKRERESLVFEYCTECFSLDLFQLGVDLSNFKD